MDITKMKWVAAPLQIRSEAELWTYLEQRLRARIAVSDDKGASWDRNAFTVYTIYTRFGSLVYKERGLCGALLTLCNKKVISHRLHNAAKSRMRRNKPYVHDHPEVKTAYWRP